MQAKSNSKRGTHLLSVGLLCAAGVVVVAGLVSRHLQAEQLNDKASEQSILTVTLVAPSRVSGSAIELPARIEPWARAPIYARVPGYLKNWKADIGAPVKSGQLLAVIETPDLDQQLLQAKAELATARSNVTLASSTAQRWQALLKSDSVSRQEADEKAGDLAAKQSAVSAMEANVERINALKRYTRLTAPFDGVVTARNTDVGALINVGGTPGSELFVVSDIHRLRIYVNVPQRQVAQFKPGTKAQLTLPEQPGKTFEAVVRSSAGAIASSSGTMLIQLSVDNPDGQLLPGGYATLRLAASGDSGTLSVPPAALILGRNGPQVAILGAQNTVLLKKVNVVRDMGNVIELAGIGHEDRIINSPPDGLANGDRVRIAAETGTAKAEK